MYNNFRGVITFISQEAIIKPNSLFGHWGYRIFKKRLNTENRLFTWPDKYLSPKWLHIWPTRRAPALTTSHYTIVRQRALESALRGLIVATARPGCLHSPDEPAGVDSRVRARTKGNIEDAFSVCITHLALTWLGHNGKALPIRVLPESAVQIGDYGACTLARPRQAAVWFGKISDTVS